MSPFWTGFLAAVALVAGIAYVVCAVRVAVHAARQAPASEPRAPKALPPGPHARQEPPETHAELASALETPEQPLPRFGATLATFYLPEAGEEPLECTAGHRLTPGEVFWPVPVLLPGQDAPEMLAVCSEHVVPHRPLTIEEV